MINKEQFVKLIEDHIQFDKRIDEVSALLKVDIFESDLIMYGSSLFDQTLNLMFDEAGVDHINWWLYEKQGRPDFKMMDVNGNEIPTETIDDLWNLVIANRI